MQFSQLFQTATGWPQPYDYQRRLAMETWPDMLDVPTGMGKTAAVTVAWLWKRGWRKNSRTQPVDAATPRRLVWCLPMRVLVEQTQKNIHTWLSNLGIRGAAGDGKVSVHVLMGSEADLATWAEHPEEDMILIGTQDMLLSRALMRGYGMSRYQWPIHFALLHNDCLWVFDEVQLMGAGLATSTQLDAFRRGFPLGKPSRSLWVSATLDPDWLATVDMRPWLASLKCHALGEVDVQQVTDRVRAAKALAGAPVALTSDNGKQRGKTYLNDLCRFVLDNHVAQTQTLIIVNRVDRAQRLFRLLRERRPDKGDLLVHARFRAAERRRQTERLAERAPDRIVVATQAIEAGVDISSRTLITELAPWASLVQRFGRCNRYGEYNRDGADVHWIDIQHDEAAQPYRAADLALARQRLAALQSASPLDLLPTDATRPLGAVLRRRDLLDLFNTDPDLSGYDVDVSDYIRDSGRPGVQVFWRDFDDDPNQPEAQSRPARDELCPISIGQAGDLPKRGAWYWDALDRKWAKLGNDREVRPGMTLLLRAADGGYDEQIGFDADDRESAVRVVATPATETNDAYGDDWPSRQNKPVPLSAHLGHVADHASALCSATGESRHAASVVRAGRWHDLGKAHAVFDATMHACNRAPAGLLAKSPCRGQHSRRYFRHELASMLGWLAQHDGEPEADLIAYLIAAHHGKVRMSVRAMPGEEADKGVKRFARGIWEGDILPALEFDGEHSAATTLKLALMEIGLGAQGPSWSERTLKLLDQYGPFQLAWLETLVRLADWRASAAEQQQP